MHEVLFVNRVFASNQVKMRSHVMSGVLILKNGKFRHRKSHSETMHQAALDLRTLEMTRVFLSEVRERQATESTSLLQRVHGKQTC